MSAREVTLTPAKVREQFPNALMAITNKKTVALAEKQGRNVIVAFGDYLWGRTALGMWVAKPGEEARS